MFSVRLRLLSIASIVALAACSGGPVGSPPQLNSVDSQYAQLRQEVPEALPGPQSGFIPFMSANPVRPACAQVTDSRHARCFALVRTDLRPTLATAGIPAGVGYGPADLQAAYKAPSSTAGKGQTIGIVDAYGYPGVGKELAVYRSAAGLPPCTIKNGCLKVFNQGGQTKPLPQPDTFDDWRYEQALDLDTVSAMCPNCHIVLIQTNDNAWVNLFAGVAMAVTKGANVISNSYGGTEDRASDPAFEHTGHVFVASAGDNGPNGSTQRPGPEQPCTYQGVICVGGTALLKAHNARGWTERVWNTLSQLTCGGGQSCGATGSGCAALSPKPAWQNSRQNICNNRAEADISADASVNTPIAVYVLQKWYGIGGTSAAAPLVAAMTALAGNAGTAAQPQRIWKANKSAAFYDVINGSNVNKQYPCPTADNKFICNARAGYDGPTGWGTPHGISGL